MIQAVSKNKMQNFNGISAKEKDTTIGRGAA